jgi:regulator of protease activity HflC (stomatin/prohibitin superfamily)
MRTIRIKQGTVGLLFKNGEYLRFLNAGKYWIRLNQTVRTYSLFEKFEAPVQLDLLLKDQELASRLILLEVKDNEIALQFEKGYLKKVLKSGVHSFWRGEVDYTFKTIDLTETAEIMDIDMNILRITAIANYTRLFTVESFEKGLLFVNGNFERTLGAGSYRFWNNATSISVAKVDTRQQQLEVSGQEILTRDKAALRVNFYVSYQVSDIKRAIIDNKNYVDQLYILMQFALREFIGTLSLDELLEKKDEVAKYILSNFSTKANELGVTLKNAGIRDAILPGEIKEIMNQVLVAQKKAQANIITRREETASTRSLLNTAKLMEDNKMLYKLKEMEYVEKIAEKIGEITVSGNGNAVEQLKEIFTPNKK